MSPRELILSPLEAEQIRSLLASQAESAERTGDTSAWGDQAATSAVLARESGGNPFVITELLRAAAAGAEGRPDGGEHGSQRPDELFHGRDERGEAESGEIYKQIDDQITNHLLVHRFARLSDDARALLVAIAVARQPFPLGFARRVAAPGDATAALVGLQKTHLVRLTGMSASDFVEIHHDRIAEAILQTTPEDDLIRCHRRFAQALENPDAVDSDVEALLHHWRSAGENRRAGQYALIAADRAHVALAFDRAAELYRTGLELVTLEAARLREVRIRLGDALAAGGRSAEAAEAYLAAASETDADSARTPAGASTSSGEGRSDTSDADDLELRRRAGMQMLVAGRVDRGLAEDRPQDARRAVESQTASWTGKGFHVQHFIMLMSDLNIDLYLGDAEQAWRRLEARWSALERSLLLRVQQPRILIRQIRARCALAMARAAPGDARRFLRQADRMAKNLSEESLPWSDGFAALIRAATSALRDDRSASLAQLGMAEDAFARAHMAIYRQACLCRRGQLVGGGSGAATLERAGTEIAGRGVRSVGRIVATHAPGFEPLCYSAAPEDAETLAAPHRSTIGGTNE